MNKYTILYFSTEKIPHNWWVYRDGERIGVVHYQEENGGFGGNIYGMRINKGFTYSEFDEIETLCANDLAERILLKV